MRVKLFTQSVTSIFNLIPGDIGRPLSDLKSKLENENLVENVRQVMKSLQPIEREVSADGDWYLMRILPYRTTEDRIDVAAITFIEITRRVQGENNLRASLEHLNEIIESIDNAFYALDADFNIVFINKKAEELWYRKRETLMGRNFWEEFPEAVGSESYKMHYKALKQQKPIYYETISPVLGHWIEARVFPDNRGGLSCYFRDITERKRAEQQINLNEEQLKMLVESATDYAIFTVDDSNLVTTWSVGAELIFGFNEAEIIGKPGEILFTAEDRERGIPEMEVKTARTTGRAEDERWHVRKDGTIFFASGVMQPLQSNGKSGFVKICRDHTEKIKTETVLKEKDMLKRLVSTQEDERRRIARDMHDHLGQQLTALRLQLESLRKNCGEEEMCRQIEEVQKSAERLDYDVDFLAWELRPAALDDLGLRVTLSDFIKEWSQYAGVKSALHTFGLGKKRFAYETETNLYRIAQEALNNIYKHSKAKNVSVLLEKRSNTISLIIEDDGVGFNPTAKVNRSKGIGIVGMRERAGICGGTLEIESKKGKGTTIYVRVPYRTAVEGKKNDK
jgi:two-component system CheB/CheR fusion protein